MWYGGTMRTCRREQQAEAAASERDAMRSAGLPVTFAAVMARNPDGVCGSCGVVSAERFAAMVVHVAREGAEQLDTYAWRLDDFGC